MSSLFNDNEEFDEYLKQQVKNHRMYPSDNIWRNIQTTIHGEYSWHALPVIAIFIIAALTAGTLLTKPNNDLPKAQYHPVISASSIAVTEKQSISSSEILRQHLSPENITQQTIAQVSKDMSIANDENIAASYVPVPSEDVSRDLAAIKNQVIPQTDFTKTNISAKPLFFAATENFTKQNDQADDKKDAYLNGAINPDNVFSFMRAIPEKHSGFSMEMESSVKSNYEFKSPYAHNYAGLNLWHKHNNNISSADNGFNLQL